MRRSRSIGAGVVGALALLAACGAPRASAPSVAPTTRAAAATGAPTSASQPAAVRPTAGAAITAAATAARTASTTNALVAGLKLPQSRTPEGYHVLGNPQAPVTIQFYSDFL